VVVTTPPRLTRSSVTSAFVIVSLRHRAERPLLAAVGAVRSGPVDQEIS
jgi:hypothetical protein